MYITVRKTTKGQKIPNCIQLVLATQYMCVQLYKAKRSQLFFKTLLERVNLKDAGRCARSLVLHLRVWTPADKKNVFLIYTYIVMFVIVMWNPFHCKIPT